MQFVRFLSNGKAVYGQVNGDQVAELEGSIFGDYRPTGRSLPLKDAKLLAPCVPSKVPCFGLNYAAHARESGAEIPKSPILFFKAPSALIGPNETIVLPDHESRIDHEAELGVVIKDITKGVSEREALQHVFGYTCANDVSHRPIQRSDGQWCRAKSFDTFGPLGPCIATDLDPGNLGIKALVNGEVKQSSNTNDLIFSVPYLVSWLSQCMTLLPGDVIMTGTPSGVGPLKAGDTVEIWVEGVGSLSNPVK